MSGACNCTVFSPGPSMANSCGGSAFFMFMGLLEQFLRSQCDVEDPCGRVDSLADPLSDYDFIVVGGGSAGSVVASRLSEESQWKREFVKTLYTRLLRGGSSHELLPASPTRSMLTFKARPSSSDYPTSRRIQGGGVMTFTDQKISDLHIFDSFTIKVLLVEAGINEPTGSQVPGLWVNFFGSAIDWKYKTEPEKMACLASPQQRCSWPRGKVIGGTSVINGMMYMRGSRKDYDDWAIAGNTGWAYKDVLPYFMKSEDNLQIAKVDEGYHGTGGPLPVSQFPYHPPIAEAFLEGAKELGQRVGDLNGKIHEGFAIAQATNKNGIRYSSAHAFLRPAKTRSNLHILLNTTVARVLVDPKTKTAFGIEIIKPSGKTEQILAKKEVVVSGGAVNSPQILLLSGIGPKEDLEKLDIPVVHDLPGVGKNLHNHVGHTIKFYMDSNATADLDWATAMQYMLYRDGLMSSTGLSSLTGIFKSKFANPLEDHPDIQMFFGGYKANCAKTGEVGDLLDKNKDGSPKKRIITMTPTNLHPKSRGFLTLKDKNPLSYPIIVARYLTEIEDVQRVIEGIKFGIQLAETKALEKFVIKLDTTPNPACKSHTFNSDEYWECAVRQNTAPENHPAGSCKMGSSSDPLAVVDPQLNVKGIKNLRVIDASIMPKLTSGNTNAVCIMIGEKGSDMIRKKWSKQ